MKLNLGDLISYKGYKSTDEIQFGMIVKIFEGSVLGYGTLCFVEWGTRGLMQYPLESLSNCVHFRGSEGITGWCLVLKYDSHDSIALKLDSTQHHD